jgi:hypothetical protein
MLLRRSDYEADREVQEAVRQSLRFGEREFAVQEQGLGPGEQVDAGRGQFQPGLVFANAREANPRRGACRSWSS